MKKMTVKKWIGFLSKLLVAAVVFAFMAMKSIDFFTFATPADQWYYAWLGFGLTGGGVIMELSLGVFYVSCCYCNFFA